MSARVEIPVAGGTLAAFELGSGTGPPVVAVHGITANSQAWRAAARALAPDAGLLAVDLRGRGKSNRLPGPYGLASHARDVLAVLDHLGLERAVLAGHSLGAYIVARVAAEHPDRVAALVLVDGGLAAPPPQDIDPQAIIAAALGPALARLKLTFESLATYVDWWHAHPAFADGAVGEDDLTAYAAHDLVGTPPAMRPGVAEAAVRADAEEVLEVGHFADELSVPATLLRAPRGLMNEPSPFQPPELAKPWADAAPEQRRVLEIPDVNHYSMLMGARGAGVVADAIRAALTASTRTGSR
jgi:pimeloyl-ACP methyl ester carboxylesterase